MSNATVHSPASAVGVGSAVRTPAGRTAVVVASEVDLMWVAATPGALSYPALVAKTTPMAVRVTARAIAADPDAGRPEFDRFLARVQPEREVRLLLQQLAGYLLTADTSLHKFFIWFGSGANGKGVLLNMFTALLGRYNVSAVPLSRFGERFALWPLTTSLLSAVTEMPTAEAGAPARVAEDCLKAVATGDAIEVERKNRDVFTARPTARLIFSTNDLPIFSDRSDGVRRRAVIVPFDAVISDAEQDADLANRIVRDELPGVLNWAIDGLLSLQGQGRFVEPDACSAIRNRHRPNCAPELEFLGDHCSPGTGQDFVPSETLYKAYRRHCAANGCHAMGNVKFSMAVKRRFPEAKNHR